MAECINCKKELNQGRNCTGKYCSSACQRLYEFEAYIRAWKNGEVDGTTQGGASAYIRRYLFIKYNKKCCECGWSEINSVTNRVPLEVEHIDGNYMNNKEENLKLICPNCHSLTPTYKGLNRGKGRHHRLTRYKDGKSF